MEYSVEDIFLYSGQYDKVVNISFKKGSESQKEYGDYLIGEFIYSPSERLNLQRLVEEENYTRTNGRVRFKDTTERISDAKREFLRREGVLASDIVGILQFSGESFNAFSYRELRELPKPIILEVDFDRSLFVEQLLFTFNLQLSNGFALIPNEVDQYHAAILTKCGENAFGMERIGTILDKETGTIRTGVRYHFFRLQCEMGIELTKEEGEEYVRLICERARKRHEIAYHELLRTTENPRSIGAKYPYANYIFNQLIYDFDDIRLTMSQFAVWLDFGRYIHIMVGHVSEMLIGERNLEKTQFQYRAKDIIALIEKVVKEVDNEIQAHFISTPEKEFRRNGRMSVYYNGDYYQFRIRPDGRLMQFHKLLPVNLEVGDTLTS